MIRNFPFWIVLNWYENNGRYDLPWRQVYHEPLHDRLYKVWIAEVMLQQTQVDRVIWFYNRFLEKYPTIESLASTTYDELFPYYQGLGYYGRARRMIELAKVVVEKYDGIFPDNFETLRKLPWIGTYTAKAILAFGYDIPVLAMDANLIKIFARYYLGSRHSVILGQLSESEAPRRQPGDSGKILREASSQKNNATGLDTRLRGYDEKPNLNCIVTQLEQQLRDSKISGRAINNALMDFWALVSTTFDKVDKESYPLQDCLWFTTQGTLEPIKKKVIRRQEKWAKLIVFLHEAHKSYWSSSSHHFEPFLVEPMSSGDRRTVQDYFSATFGLEVSVRPSFGSGIFEWMPVKLFHAQIQTGSLNQKTFSKKEKEEWIEKNVIINIL
jgi:A/G-specific adenine glycosylase